MKKNILSSMLAQNGISLEFINEIENISNKFDSISNEMKVVGELIKYIEKKETDEEKVLFYVSLSAFILKFEKISKNINEIRDNLINKSESLD